MCKHILAVLMALKLRQGEGETGREGEDSPCPLVTLSPCRSLWDRQQAIARFQEYVRRVQEEGDDPRLLFVLAQMM